MALFFLAAVFAPMCLAGGDFAVNLRSSLDQANPAIAGDGEGNFVVVWNSYYQGKSNEIIGRFFGKEGEALNGEFEINQTQEGNQKKPAVAMNEGRGFVVAWQSEDSNDKVWIFARRFDTNGVGLDEFRLNDEPNGKSPAVTLNDNGSFVVVWEQQEIWQPFDVHNIRFQCYDANGSAVASGQANLLAQCRNPDVGMNEDGEFVIVWMQDDTYHSLNVIMARRHNSDGLAISDPFEVSVTGFDTIAGPTVSVNRSGEFLVTWDGAEYTQYNQVYARLYEADGSAITDEFVANSVTSAENENPKCSINNSGDSVLVWERQVGGLSGKDVFGQRYDVAGNIVGDEFRINTYVYDDQRNAVVLNRDDGTFAAVWQSKGQDGSAEGIFGSIGPHVGTPDLDGDGFVNFADYCIISGQWAQQGSGLAGNLIDDNEVDSKDVRAFCEQWLTYRYSCELADVSGEGAVDFKDFATVARDLGRYGPLPGDIDGDGTVNLTDLQWLVLHWAQRCP